VFPALIVHSELKSAHPGFPRNDENTVPETAFLGAQIAPKSLSAEASPQTPLGELTALPRPPSWIQGALLLRGGEDPDKFLRIGPGEN